MATIRDPAFWKRFSVAVHNDEKEGAAKGDGAPQEPTTRPELPRLDSWLARERAKKKRRDYICWIFWFCFFGFVAGVVVLVIFLKQSGVFEKLDEATSPHR